MSEIATKTKKYPPNRRTTDDGVGGEAPIVSPVTKGMNKKSYEVVKEDKHEIVENGEPIVASDLSTTNDIRKKHNIPKSSSHEDDSKQRRDQEKEDTFTTFSTNDMNYRPPPSPQTSSNNFDVKTLHEEDGGPVHAVPIDEEAYRAEVLRQAKLNLPNDALPPITPTPLVHAVPADSDASQKKRCRTMAFVMGSLFLLVVVLGIGLGVGLSGSDENNSPQSFNEFCFLLIGFYTLEMPRLSCSCDDISQTVNCKGDLGIHFVGLVVQYDQGDGSYLAAGCNCNTLDDCPATSTECFAVSSKDDTNCFITESVGGESICVEGQQCELCESEKFFSVKAAQCGLPYVTECSEIVIPTPGYLEEFSVAKGNEVVATPKLAASSTYEEFCTKITSLYDSQGYFCNCTESDPDLQNHHGEDLQYVSCWKSSGSDEDESLHLAVWTYDESVSRGDYCECPNIDCDVSPVPCTTILYDHVDDTVYCAVWDLVDEDAIRCESTGCTVCDDTSEGFFRVDSSSCDGQSECRAVELYF